MFLFRYHKGNYSATQADKRLIDYWLDWFISDQLSPFHRKTVPDLKRIQEIAIDIVFFFNLAVVEKVTIFFNNVMYLDDAFRSPVGPYIRSIWNRNISFSQIVWLCIISTVGILISWSSLQ